MAKHGAVSRKELLKEPDQFLATSGRTMRFLMDNQAAAIGVVVAVILAGTAFFGFRYYQETQTLHNEALYFEMENVSKNGSDSVSEVKAVWEKIGDGLQKQRASLLLADIHFRSQDYDKAEALYITVMNNSSAGQINYQMAQMGLAYSHESLKDYKKAIDLFKSVVDANTSFPLFEVYWSLSRCYELNNDGANALLVLREMQIKFSNDPQADKIERRIKQLSA